MGKYHKIQMFFFSRKTKEIIMVKWPFGGILEYVLLLYKYKGQLQKRKRINP